MSIPIKETPILTGKNARRFAIAARNAHKNPVSRENYKRAKKIYETMKKQNKIIDF